MGARAYLLLEIKKTEINKVINMLRKMPAVRMVDMLDGSPNLIVMVQARNRQRLATMTNQVIASIEPVTLELKLLPVENIYDKVEKNRKRLLLRK